MFQLTQTTVINSALDIDGVRPKFAGIAPAAPDPGIFRVFKGANFYADLITAAYNKVGFKGVKGTLILNFTTLVTAPGIYRLALYIRLSGSQNSIYANDMVFKGKPLYFEFEVLSGDTATQIATKFLKAVDAVQKNYNYNYVTYSGAGTSTITLTFVDEYQTWQKAQIQKYYPYDPATETGGQFVTTVDVLATPANFTQSVQGFGTYQHLIKDYKIPTLESRRWEAVGQEELPVPGALYNQYTFEYTTNRGILGSDAVGQPVSSITSHVFWVKQDVVTDWDKALDDATIVPIVIP